MTESVEQAALRRAAERDELPEPWSGVLEVLERLSGNISGMFELMHLIRERHDEEIVQLHAENVELRDGLLALSNRIENVGRIVGRLSVEDSRIVGFEPPA